MTASETCEVDGEKSDFVPPEQASAPPASQAGQSVDLKKLTRLLKAAKGKGEVPPPELLASLFVHLFYIGKTSGRLLLRYHRGVFYAFKGTHYAAIPKADFNADIMRWLKGKANATKATRDNVLEHIIAFETTSGERVKVRDDVDAPCWLNGDTRYVLPYQNGLVLLNEELDRLDRLAERLQNGDAGDPADDPPAMLPHTPDWFSTNYRAFDYDPPRGRDPGALAPIWDHTLAVLLRDDESLIALVQEAAGYCLELSTDEQVMFMLHGEGGTGKSTVLAGFICGIGKDNVSSVPISALGKSSNLVSMMQKHANIISETGETDKVAEDTLKKIVSGEAVHIDPKYVPAFDAVLPARWIVATNNRPRFADKTNGIYRRIISIPFEYVVPAGERTIGKDKPDWWLRWGEAPGIANSQFEGLRRRRAHGWTHSAVAEQDKAEYRRENNSVALFCAEYVESSLNPDDFLLRDDLYQKYKAYCKDAGYQAVSKITFAKLIRPLFSGIGKNDRKRGPGGKQLPSYNGIRWKADAPPDPPEYVPPAPEWMQRYAMGLAAPAPSGPAPALSAPQTDAPTGTGEKGE